MQTKETRSQETTTLTFTKTTPPEWLLAFWKEIDDKTFGKGFDCFVEDARCRLGVAEWNGREVIRENLRAAPEMQSITKALERVLRQHEPFPAMVMDRYWYVILKNDAAPRFFKNFIDLEKRESPRNLLHLMFDPAGMRPYIANWEDVAAGLFQRVYRESVGRVVDEKTKELLATLQAYPDVKTVSRKPQFLSTLPFIPISFVKKGKTLNFFSMITTVGAPLSITAQELRMECMFPADEESEIHYLKMMATKPKGKK